MYKSDFIVKSYISNNNYKAALEVVKKEIEDYPADPILYYYKAVALVQKVEAQEEPFNLEKYINQMNEAFSHAKKLSAEMDNTPDDINRIDSVKSALWSELHNKGVKYIEDDELKGSVEDALDFSISYLKNAINVQARNAVTWHALAVVNGKKQKYQEAAEAQEKFINLKDEVTVRNYLVLAQYYQQGDKNEEALHALVKAQDKFPNNNQVAAFLADAYTKLEKEDKALAIVERLAEQEPENPQYQLSLGSRFLITSLNVQHTYKENVDKIFEYKDVLDQASNNKAEQTKQKIETLQQENMGLFKEISQLQDRAEKHIQLVLKFRPDDDTAYNNLGVIYQNRAALYYKLRNLAQSKEEAIKYNKKAEKLLRKAMDYYQKAANLEPENPDYWKSLHVIYKTLELDEEASKVAKKAGLK